MNVFQAGESDLNGGQDRELLVDIGGDSPTSDPTAEASARNRSLESVRWNLIGQSQAPKCRRRAAMRLSRVDTGRLTRGEIANPEEALHLNDLYETRLLQYEESAVTVRNTNERRLLGDRPPRFSTL